MKQIMEIFRAVGIVPVVKINNPDAAVPMAKALLAGGLPAAEITFRSAAAAESIRRICAEVPEVAVCAGTVLTEEHAQEAMRAGAKAIISPGTNTGVVRWCAEREIPVIPGCATPTELETCMRMGLGFVKLFPAQVLGGVELLKALAGPYGGMRFMPTGGVNIQNAADYLAQPNVVCCGGSWMVSEKLLDNGEFETVRELAREAAALCRAARKG